MGPPAIKESLFPTQGKAERASLLFLRKIYGRFRPMSRIRNAALRIEVGEFSLKRETRMSFAGDAVPARLPCFKGS